MESLLPFQPMDLQNYLHCLAIQEELGKGMCRAEMKADVQRAQGFQPRVETGLWSLLFNLGEQHLYTEALV